MAALVKASGTEALTEKTSAAAGSYDVAYML